MIRALVMALALASIAHAEPQPPRHLPRWVRAALLQAFDDGFTCGWRVRLCLDDPEASRDCAEQRRACEAARAQYESGTAR